MKPLNILSLPSGVDGSLSARSTDGGKASAGPASARGGGGGGGVTARSLSRLSIASCNSIYYDASEDLEGPPLSSALFSSLHWHGNLSCWSPISPRPNPLVTSTLDIGSLPAPEISFTVWSFKYCHFPLPCQDHSIPPIDTAPSSPHTRINSIPHAAIGCGNVVVRHPCSRFLLHISARVPVQPITRAAIAGPQPLEASVPCPQAFP